MIIPRILYRFKRIFRVATTSATHVDRDFRVRRKLQQLLDQFVSLHVFSLPQIFEERNTFFQHDVQNLREDEANLPLRMW